MNDQELALIGLWAHADWTAVARSITTGKPEKPQMLGGSIPGCRSGYDRTAAALAPARSWWADGTGIHSGANTHSDPDQLAHLCTWPAALRWIRAFTDHERSELGRVHACFYAAYAERTDEEHMLAYLHGQTEIWHACRDRYAARMRDGGSDAIAGCKARFREILEPHLQPSAPAHPKCPFGYGDRVEHHATAIGSGGMPWDRVHWDGTVLGSLGSTLLRGVKDDGTTWADYWTALVPEGRPTRCYCHPPVQPAQRSLFDLAVTA